MKDFKNLRKKMRKKKRSQRESDTRNEQNASFKNRYMITDASRYI